MEDAVAEPFPLGSDTVWVLFVFSDAVLVLIVGVEFAGERVLAAFSGLLGFVDPWLDFFARAAGMGLSTQPHASPSC